MFPPPWLMSNSDAPLEFTSEEYAPERREVLW
jgi:hypothetical protein